MVNKAQIKFFCFIVITSSLGQMAAEIYAPSLTYISHDFKASHSLVQISISCYLLGMALPAVIYGHLSDYFGRRRIMLTAGSISFCGTFLCAVAPNIETLIIGRIIQGIGFAGVSSTGRAIIRDRLHGLELAKYASYMSMAVALSIDLAPFIGGFLQEYFGWRSTFWLILGYNLMVLMAAYKFDDKTVLIKGRVTLNSLGHNLLATLKNPVFIGYNLICACGYSIFMLYLAVASFIVQGTLGKSPVWFGSMTLGLSFIFVISSYINGRLLHHFNILKLIRLGIAIVFTSVVFFVIGAIIQLSIYWFILCAAPLFCGLSFILSNADSQAFNNIHQRVGIASAISSSLRLITAMIMIALISIFNPHGTFPLAVLIGLTASVMAYTLRRLNKPQ